MEEVACRSLCHKVWADNVRETAGGDPDAIKKDLDAALAQNEESGLTRSPHQ